MRILLKIRGSLLCSRQTHFFKTNLQLVRPITNADNSIGSRYFSIFTSKIHQNLDLNRIRCRNISVTSVKSNENQNLSKKTHSDGVSIYTGKYNWRIIRVKIFSLTTSALGVCAQPYLWQKSQLIGSTGLGVLVCSIVGVFTFITPILIHFIMKKYVVDIRYNKETDEYTCYTISFFLFKNRTKFKVEEIHIPEIETMFTSMKVGPKNVPLFVDAESFNDPHHYARFMGYDKPLKFDLSKGLKQQSIEAEANDHQISDDHSHLTDTEHKKKEQRI